MHINDIKKYSKERKPELNAFKFSFLPQESVTDDTDASHETRIFEPLLISPTIFEAVRSVEHFALGMVSIFVSMHHICTNKCQMQHVGWKLGAKCSHNEELTALKQFNPGKIYSNIGIVRYKLMIALKF